MRASVETVVRQLADRVDELDADTGELCDVIGQHVGKLAGVLAIVFGVNILEDTTEAIAQKLRDQGFDGVEGVTDRVLALEAECAAKDETIQQLQDSLDAARAQVARQARTIVEKITAPEPTWTSANGRTQAISKMATPHLENVLGLLYQHGLSPRQTEHGSGLYEAIRRELERRGEVVAA